MYHDLWVCGHKEALEWCCCLEQISDYNTSTYVLDISVIAKFPVWDPRHSDEL